MASFAQWVEGARPRTLPLSAAPVVAGSAVALAGGAFHPWRALLALVVGVALQIGVNFANDYSDGVRGTDAHRVGPQRLVGSAAATPGAVKRAAFVCFGAACLAGLGLVVLTQQWWLIAVGAACVVAAWFYTGGKHPYGYAGLGEVFVFVFFGVVATAGTVFVQTGPGYAGLMGATLMASLGQGAGACAVLVANNLRDIPTDRLSGKKTLSVRLGDQGSRTLFIFLAAVSSAATIATAVLSAPAGLLCVVMVFFLGPATSIVARRQTGMRLVRVLKLVGVAQLAGALGLFVGALLETLL